MHLVHRSQAMRRAIMLPCAFMVIWVLFAPATWKAGTFKGHQERLLELARHQDHTPVPRDVVTKYKDQPFVRFIHILPGAAWSLCAAMQIQGPGHGAWRLLHRLSGRAMLAASAMILAGYFVLESEGLAADEDGALGRLAMAVWLAITTGGTLWTALRVARAVSEPGAVQALQQLKAVHASWALRHLMSGIWVIVQRILLIMLSNLAHLGLLNFKDASEAVRVQWFTKVGVVAWLGCVIGGELWIYAFHRDKVVHSKALVGKQA